MNLKIGDLVRVNMPGQPEHGDIVVVTGYPVHAFDFYKCNPTDKVNDPTAFDLYDVSELLPYIELSPETDSVFREIIDEM